MELHDAKNVTDQHPGRFTDMKPKVVFWSSGQYVDQVASFARSRDFLGQLFSVKISDVQYAFECRSMLDTENRTLIHWIFFPCPSIFMGHIRGYPKITDEKNYLISKPLAASTAEEIEQLRSILADQFSTYVPIDFVNQRKNFTATKVVFERHNTLWG